MLRAGDDARFAVTRMLIKPCRHDFTRAIAVFVRSGQHNQQRLGHFAQPARRFSRLGIREHLFLAIGRI